MRATTSLILTLTPFLALAHAATANDTSSCSTTLQIYVARGTGETSATGKMGLTATAVAGVVPNVNITGVPYPAVASDYFESVANGTGMIMDLVKRYTQKCPTGRVVLMGYSQGGQVIMDALCGTSSLGFKEQPGLGGALADNLVAAIIFGDPSYRANVSYGYGSSTRDGLFPRVNEAGCAPYASKIRSYCDRGDVFCSTGSNRTAHNLYVEEYTPNVADFILEKVKENPGSGTSSSSGSSSPAGGARPSGTSSPTGPTPSPTPTTRNSAPGIGAGYMAYVMVGFVASLNGLQS